ncbi:MAG: diguanylate cyclase [Planctomycetaceae bacterium]|nr:diguanylate cyclase [Planctomycetaceae bacterium]
MITPSERYATSTRQIQKSRERKRKQSIAPAFSPKICKLPILEIFWENDIHALETAVGFGVGGFSPPLGPVGLCRGTGKSCSTTSFVYRLKTRSPSDEVRCLDREETLQFADILIVNNDPEVLEQFTQLLESSGYGVRIVSNGNQALQMMLQECPDVLIVDWTMPDFDGMELCRRVRQLHRRKLLPHYTHIILLTPFTEKKHFVEGLEAGADYLVEKVTDLHLEMWVRLKAALRARKLEKDLEFAAKYDAMTKLLNRVTFYDSAQVLWERSIKNKFPLSLIMLDCDFFKRVNDIHGHLAGDCVLQEIAATLRNFTRTSDLICRYGGEEFCVLLPGCNEKTAWNWAERIRKQFEKFPIKYESLEISITVSFGIAERMDDTLQFDHLVEKADQAMLFAKESGRNRVICFSETIAEDTEHSQELRTIYNLFDGVFARDVMVPITLTVNLDETVSNVADFFLQMQVESLPVVDRKGHFCGVISDKVFLSLIGNKSRWNEAISDLITPNIICYPTETPLRTIYDFLCRVSVRQIILVEENRPVGFLNRSLLLRWMRNMWISIVRDFDSIIPCDAASLKFTSSKELVELIRQNLVELSQLLEQSGDEAWSNNRYQLTALISQIQNLMDQVLRSNVVKVHDITSGMVYQISGSEI